MISLAKHNTLLEKIAKSVQIEYVLLMCYNEHTNN